MRPAIHTKCKLCSYCYKNQYDEQGNPITIQQEFQVDPNAKLFRVGFTEGEVEEALTE